MQESRLSVSTIVDNATADVPAETYFAVYYELRGPVEQHHLKEAVWHATRHPEGEDICVNQT